MTKVFTKSLLMNFKKIVRRLRPFVHAQPPPPPPPPPSACKREPDNIIRWPSDELPAPDTTTKEGGVTVCKVKGGLQMSPSIFPYFILVALEAGGLFRGLLLLLLYPAATAVPREMVETFWKEYLGVDAVVAPELRAFGGYYLGLTESEAEVLQRLDMEEVIGGGDKEKRGGGDGDNLLVVGIGGLGRPFDQLFQQYCKEVHVATESARRPWRPLHPRRYANPRVFHDGRTAFRPTASSTLAMFMWLLLGAPLAVLRTAVFLPLPFSLSVQLLAALGMYSRRIIGSSSSSLSPATTHNLFVCNHRSLVDPLYVSAATGRADLATATYSISRLSETLAPTRTFRLTHDRATDRAAMQAHMSCPGAGGGGGGLVVCPEGTTCREAFLLRFSPLYTELGGDVQFVALHSAVSMFHGTTAGGRKLLDPLYLLMNLTPAYVVQLLDPIAIDGGGPELENKVQRRIAEALGYTCTMLTRRDKHLALTGSDGVDRCRRRQQQ